MKRIFICVAIMFGLFSISGCGEKKELVWLVSRPEFIELRQELLDQYLRDKGVDYTVRLETFIVNLDSIDNIEEYSQEEIDELITFPLYETYTEELLRMKAENEQVDILYIPYAQNNYEYAGFTELGLLENLDSYLAEEDCTLYDALHEIAWDCLKLNGSIYGVSQEYLAYSHSYAYSTYYMDKYNIDISDIDPVMTNNEELFDQIYEAEGEELPIMVMHTYLEDLFSVLKLTPSRVVGINKEGKAVNIYEDETVIDYLEGLQKLNEKGYLYFYNYEEGAYEMYLESNYTFGTNYGANYLEPEIVTHIHSNEPEVSTEVAVIPEMLGNELGYYPVLTDVNAIASWSENKELAFSFLELLYTDKELANLIAYGEEGTDYILEDGKVTYTYSRFSHFTNGLLTYPIAGEPDDKEGLQEFYYNTGAHDVTRGFRFDASAVMDEIIATNEVMVHEYEKTELGRKLDCLDTDDLDALLAELNEKLEAAGIQKIIDEANRQLKIYWASR